MTIQEAIRERHSVRQFTDRPVPTEAAEELNALIKKANEESGLNMQLVLNDPDCFNTLLAHYGKFRNAVNYIAVVGPKDMADLDERGGYYGQPGDICCCLPGAAVPDPDSGAGTAGNRRGTVLKDLPGGGPLAEGP